MVTEKVPLLTIYTLNGHIFRFDTFTPTISHSERDLKENAINDRFE